MLKLLFKKSANTLPKRSFRARPELKAIRIDAQPLCHNRFLSACIVFVVSSTAAVWIGEKGSAVLAAYDAYVPGDDVDDDDE